MIEPKKKHSIARKRTRHSTWQTLNIKRIVNKVSLSTCQNCKSSKLNHRVCPTCGFYNGKQIRTIKTKSAGTVIDA